MYVYMYACVCVHAWLRYRLDNEMLSKVIELCALSARLFTQVRVLLILGVIRVISGE